jgi:hypothetical protein
VQHFSAQAPAASVPHPYPGRRYIAAFKDAEEQAAARSEILGPRVPLLRCRIVHFVDETSSTPPRWHGPVGAAAVF